jgi:hypothetical protein
MSDTAEVVIGDHMSGPHGHYCQCGKQAQLGQAVGWYPTHLLDALRDAGYTVVMSVQGAERARLKAFGRDCVTHGDMTPGAERMLDRILDGETP